MQDTAKTTTFTDAAHLAGAGALFVDSPAPPAPAAPPAEQLAFCAHTSMWMRMNMPMNYPSARLDRMRIQ